MHLIILNEKMYLNKTYLEVKMRTKSWKLYTLFGGSILFSASPLVPGSCFSCGSILPAIHDVRQDEEIEDIRRNVEGIEELIGYQATPTPEIEEQPTVIPSTSDLLQELAGYANTIPRATEIGADVKWYKIWRNTDGSFRNEEIPKEEPNPAGLQHIISAGINDYKIVGIANSSLTGVRQITSGIGGENPTEYRHIFVLPENILEGVFSVNVYGDNGYIEILRAITE